MGATNTNLAGNGTRATIAGEINNAGLQSEETGAAAKTSTSAKAEARPTVALAATSHSVAAEIGKPAAEAEKKSSIAPAGKRSGVAGAATRKTLSREIMLTAGRSTTAKTRPVPAKELAPGFAASFPAMMPMASDAPGTRPAFPREAIPALRLHFQSSRAEYVERRLNPHNEGVVELYCKLCLRLIVASRDEFVFPIAVKAHKCGRNTRSSMWRW